MRFKRDEVRTLIGVAVGFPLLAGAGWGLWGPAALIPALTIMLVGMLTVQLGGMRRVRDDLAESLRQTQALLFLNAQLRTEHPLPPLGGAALLPDSAATLVGLINERRPQTIVELGSGVSTIICAATLKQLGGGRVVSLDHETRYAQITRAQIMRQGLSPWADVRHAPLEVTHIDGQSWRWYARSALSDIERIDLLIVDGPPRKVQSLARYPAARLLLDRLAPDCVILVDDTNRRDEQEIVSRWRTEIPDFTVTEIPFGEGTTVFRRAA